MKSSIARVISAATVIFAVAISLELRASLAQKHKEKPKGHEKTEWSYAALARVPDKARAKTNPLESDPEARIAGGKLFEEHCAECHGMKAEGSSRAPSLLQAEVQEATPGAIFWILTNGVVRHGMPDWSKLPVPERWQIVTYLKSFRAPELPRSSPGAR
jgi:mono/diheme cytochrome c family protein